MSDPGRRDAASSSQGDPLAELARLIGQNDPFADLGRGQRAAASHQPATGHDRQGDPGSAASYPDAQQHGHAGAYAQPDAGYGPAQHDGVTYQQPHHDSPQYHDHSASDLNQPQRHEPYAEAFHAEAASQADYGQYHAAHAGQDYAYQGHYAQDDHAHVDPSAYAHSAPARRRGGLAAVMGVAALAVVGTAGAFAYRATFGTAGTPQQPPVIRAAETPNKVQTASPDSTKLIQDRVSDRPQGERVVSREEQPVDVRNSAGGPTIAYPPLAPPNTRPANTTAGGPPVLPQVATSAGPAISAEPKKIRTVAIRPDQDGASRPQPSAPAQTTAAPAAPHPSASTDTPFPSTARAARQQPDANAPLSLSPTSTGSAPATGRTRTQTAALPSDRPAGSGSFVQVASQRSEADAQASFRALQGKYPGVLGGKHVVIRRADLGDKGVYYRAMVGPFGSTDEATQVCSSLKAAGGSCVVQRN